MNIEKLQEIYNKINTYSIRISREADFDYIQTEIAKISVYTDEINQVIGEILSDKTRIEHLLMDKTFEFDVRSTELMMNNNDVKQFTTGKERKEYTNYILKDDLKQIKMLEQELKDVDNLLGLARKKAKDLDRTYPKLKTLWESVSTEMKFLKKQGSDFEYINKVKNNIDEEKKINTPIFPNKIVEEIVENEYNKEENDLLKEKLPENNAVSVEDLLESI